MYLRKDQCWAWKSVVGAFIGFGITVSIDLSYSIVFKEVKSFYDVNSTIASSLFGLIIGVRLLISPLAVVAINLFGCDKVTMLGGGLVGLSLFIASCSTNMALFFISYGFLTGVGISFIYTSTLVILSENFNKKKSLAFGIASSGVSIGYIMFPHIFAVLVVQYEFRSALMILSAFSLNMVVTGLLFTRPKHINDKETMGSFLIIHNNISQSTKPQEIVKIFKESIFNIKPFKNFNFLLYACGVSWFFLGTFPWALYIVDIIQTIDGIPLNVAVLTFTVEGISQVIARISSGIILDRPCIREYRGIICSMCSFLSALYFILVVTINLSIHSYLAISMVRGLILGVFISQNVVILGDLCSPHLIPMSIGILSFLKGVGCLTGPILAGAIRDNFKSYLETFIFLSINQCVGGGLILYPFVRKIMKNK